MRKVVKGVTKVMEDDSVGDEVTVTNDNIYVEEVVLE